MKKKLLVLLCALTACCLMGCEPNYIDKKQQKEILKEGKASIKEFLDDNLESDYKLSGLNMIAGEKLGSASALGRYSTKFVYATFVTDGLTYNIYADIERDVIYWDYEFYDFGEIIQYELAEVIDLKGAEFVVPKTNFCLKVTSNGIISTHDKDTSPISTYCDITNVAPANLTKSEQKEWVDHLLSDGNATITIHYHSDELGTIGDSRTSMEYSSPLYYNEDGSIVFHNLEGRAFIYWKEKPSYSYLVEGSKKYEIGRLNNNYYSAKSGFSEAGVMQTYITQVYEVE